MKNVFGGGGPDDEPVLMKENQPELVADVFALFDDELDLKLDDVVRHVV